MKIMKKTLAVILACVMALSCCGVSFAVSQEDFIFTVKDGEAQLSYCDPEVTGIVEIPSKATVGGKEYDVAYIGIKAFYGCDGITEIIIPEGVRTVGSLAFGDCTSLTDVYMPASLISCQYNAFDGCGEMTVHCYTTSYQYFAVYGFNNAVTIEIIDKENIYDSEDSTVAGDATIDNAVSTITRIVEIFRGFLDELLAYFGVSLGDDDFEFDLDSIFPSDSDSILGGIIGDIMDMIPEEEEDDGVLGGLLGGIL